LGFPNVNTITSIQADVTISESAIVNNAQVRARIQGNWYTSAGGDVYAGVQLMADPSGFSAYWFVSYATSDIAGGPFQTPISLGNTYNLSISYDPDNNQFTFEVDDEQVISGPDGLPARVGNPVSPGKSLQTRVRTYDSTSSSFLLAAFDNVNVNGSPYDDFSSSSIDPGRWVSYEYVREISDGSLRLKGKSGPGYTSSFRNTVEFGSPALVNNIQAQVTLVDYQNPEGLFERADMAGGFYHDGSVNDGRTGDVVGQIRLGGTGTSPVAEWEVMHCGGDFHHHVADP
jgi:hypothetical protein